MTANPIYLFPPFRLSPDERQLTANDMSLKLGGRAFDTLLALVERRERTVSKEELLDIVWAKLVVEENNLQVQVVTLRKLLGHHAIATIPGRGYRFTLPVEVQGTAPQAAIPGSSDPATQGSAETVVAPSPAQAISGPLRRFDELFGRQSDVAAIGAMLHQRRVVTIAGAGGIGKTRVAEATAAAVKGQFPDGVWWVELASITDPELVPTAVATALGLSLAGVRDTLQSVVARVGERSMLIVLDNCEHLIEAVATFVDAVISAAPLLRILVTSQEVLKAGEEAVYRLGTLSVPTETDVESVVTSGSGALLVARIKGALPAFLLAADTSPAAAEICRRLDGIPLAIELAAARVPLLGIEGVRAKLDERFRMLTAGARVVLRRHQTLRAALEWSHSLLSEDERIVFRRLGVFAGGFTLESAQRVGDDDNIDAWDVLEHLGALVDKSMVLVEGDAVPRYRLLETTRLYALEQLAQAGETATSTRKHAEAIKTLLWMFEAPAKQWRTTAADWVLGAAELDNTRVALAWAEQQGELTSLCLDLASASFYVFNFANVVGEGFKRIVAFAGLAQGDVPDEVRARFLFMLARIGLAMARPESLEAALRAEELYAKLGDDERRYMALTCIVAIAARADTTVDAEAAIARAVALEQPSFPPRLRAMFQWALHRWLLRQGRPEEALVHAWQQVELTRESGAARAAALLPGTNVAYCELAMGRVDVAEERARGALAEAGGSDEGAGHLLDTWMMCLALKGRHEEALVIGHRAYADLDAAGDQFMLLDGLAMIAAEQGRLRDAAITSERSDAEFAARKFHRWPLSKEWRRRTDVLLAAVPADELARWKREAAHLAPKSAVEHALGRAAKGRDSGSPAS